MSRYVARMLAALEWVAVEEDSRRADMSWAVLSSILHNMIRRPGSQTDVLATDGYVARDIDANPDTAGDAIRRFLTNEVLEDITWTSAGDRVRERRQAEAPLPDNARVVRLGKRARDSGAKVHESPERPGSRVRSGHPDRGSETPVGGVRESGGGARDSGQLRAVEVTSSERKKLTVGDCNYALGRAGLEDGSRGTVAGLREWLMMVAPTADVWKRHTLGPKTMRVYGYVADACRPVFPRDLKRDLGISRPRGKDLLKALGDHGLAQRPPDGEGWVAGPFKPEDHNPILCDACPEQAPCVCGVPDPAWCLCGSEMPQEAATESGQGEDTGQPVVEPENGSELSEDEQRLAEARERFPDVATDAERLRLLDYDGCPPEYSDEDDDELTGESDKPSSLLKLFL